MNIFITGGNGLIGKRVSKILEKNNHVIVSFDKIIKFKSTKKIKYVRGDITKEKDLTKYLKKYKSEVILHFAANLGVEKTEKNGLDCLNVNIEGTKRIYKSK